MIFLERQHAWVMDSERPELLDVLSRYRGLLRVKLRIILRTWILLHVSPRKPRVLEVVSASREHVNVSVCQETWRLTN